MIRFFLILSLLLLNFEEVWSEEEGLSRQEKNLLRSIERIDKKNEDLGKTLSLEVREKVAEEMKGNEAFAISSGLTMIATTVEGTEATFIYRANLDISNYRKTEIQDFQDFLFKKVQENACSEPLIRSMVFVFDITFHYEFIDITNKPFGRQMNFTKADCKGIKTKGSPMLFPKDFLKLALEELS